MAGAELILARSGLRLNPAATLLLVFSVPSQLPESGPMVSARFGTLDTSSGGPGHPVFLFIPSIQLIVTDADTEHDEVYTSCVWNVAEISTVWEPKAPDGIATWYSA